jgi:hypothetical protein
MSEQDNMKLARQVIDAWNAHDPERLVKLADEKYVAESDTVPSTGQGRAGFARVHEDLCHRLSGSPFHG